MKTSSQFSILSSQFSINDQSSMIKQCGLRVCELVNEDSMEIGNWKLEIAGAGGCR